jgi:hypothetical protein
MKMKVIFSTLVLFVVTLVNAQNWSPEQCS